MYGYGTFPHSLRYRGNNPATQVPRHEGVPAPTLEKKMYF